MVRRLNMTHFVGSLIRAIRYVCKLKLGWDDFSILLLAPRFISNPRKISHLILSSTNFLFSVLFFL